MRKCHGQLLVLRPRIVYMPAYGAVQSEPRREKLSRGSAGLIAALPWHHVACVLSSNESSCPAVLDSLQPPPRVLGPKAGSFGAGVLAADGPPWGPDLATLKRARAPCGDHVTGSHSPVSAS